MNKDEITFFRRICLIAQIAIARSFDVLAPRTIRRQMLAAELSESLRRNLLWERSVRENGVMGQQRQSTTALSSSGLQPMTTIGQSESLRHTNTTNNNGASHKSNEETEKVESTMARNRS